MVGAGAGAGGVASEAALDLRESSSFWISANAASSEPVGVAGAPRGCKGCGLPAPLASGGVCASLEVGGVGRGGRSRGGTDRGADGGVGSGGKSRGGNGLGVVGAGADAGVSGAGAAVGDVPPNLAMVSSASFILRSVAFWKISSSLVMVV